MTEAAGTATPHPEVRAIIGDVVAGIHDALGARLVGIYLYGSFVTGDFDPALSDIDLLVVLADEVDDTQFTDLQALHDDVARTHPAWQDRVETHYISLAALQTFRTQQHEMIVISPGEPFHRLNVRRDYVVNWYVAREQGIAVFGPVPRTVIPPIPKEEFLGVVREHLRQWRGWVQDIDMRRPALAYAVLTLCRAFYTLTIGEQTSKRRAALWTRDKIPEWAPLIDNALLWRERWREENDVIDEAAFHATVEFVNTVVALADVRPG